MKCFSYIVARDFGFAPNPFGRYCTLATCKPYIRKSASIGDWIFGTGSTEYKTNGKLIYAMRVDEKIEFNNYWSDSRFRYKKPILNGSLRQTYGDNIYFFDQSCGMWHQENSHHSNPDGSINHYNMDRDLKSTSVLISQEFWYFGKNAVEIPQELRDTLCVKARGYKCNFDSRFVEHLLQWLYTSEKGYKGDPQLFTSFKRYDGRS